MTCRSVSIPGKGTAIVCGPRPKRRKCCACHRMSSKLCDFPVAGGTCDAPMCERHAQSIGPDLDRCPKHRQEGLPL